MWRFDCSAFGYLIKDVPAHPYSGCPTKPFTVFILEVTQLLPQSALAPENQVSTGAGHVSGIEKPFVKWLFPSAFWETVDEDRQLPLPGAGSGLCILLAVASTHSGQYPANQEGEMPARAGCRQFAQEILDKTTFLATDWGTFSKSFGPLGPGWRPLALLDDFQSTSGEGETGEDPVGVRLVDTTCPSFYVGSMQLSLFLRTCLCSTE